MDSFDSLVRDVCSAQDDVTHLNEQGPRWEADVASAIARRTRAIGQLREPWDLMLTALQDISDAMGEPLQGCDCGECTAVRNVRAAIVKAKGPESWQVS